MRDGTYRMKSYEEFVVWTENVPNRLAQLLEWLPSDVKTQLDHSIASLDLLEKWLLDQYPSLNSFRVREDYNLIKDTAASYVAAVFFKHLGGEWTIDLEDQENAFLGIPSIHNYQSTDHHLPVHPTLWVTTAIDRRTGHFIRDRVEQYIE